MAPVTSPAPMATNRLPTTNASWRAHWGGASRPSPRNCRYERLDEYVAYRSAVARRIARSGTGLARLAVSSRRSSAVNGRADRFAVGPESLDRHEEPQAWSTGRWHVLPRLFFARGQFGL